MVNDHKSSISAKSAEGNGGAAGASSRRQQPKELNEAARDVATSLSKPPVSPALLSGFVRAAEFFGIFATGLAIFLLYVAPRDGFSWSYFVPLVVAAVTFVMILELSGGYSLASLRGGMTTLARVFVSWMAVFAVLAVVAFLAKIGDDYSRVWIGTWFVAGLVLLTAVRLSAAALIRKWARSGVVERRAVIVGGGEAAGELIRALEAQPDNDIRIVGIFDDRGGDRSPPVVAGYPKLGTISELVDFARIAHVDLLIVSLPVTAESRLLQLMKQLWILPVDIRLSAHTNKLRFRPRAYSFIGAVPMLDVFDKPIADWDYIVKRAFDLTFAVIALVLLSPLMLGAALAVRLESPGPIIFRQKRYGFNNEVIEVFKFRSMFHHFSDPEAKQVVTRGDKRVTRVGRFIRKTSIDELPQLFNVLRGDLSLVGPRPHAVNAHHSEHLFEQVVDGYFARHRVKPGVTGWAQINGWRGEIDSPEKIRMRVEYDLYYIENWSVFFDLKILFLTPFSLLHSENAY